MSENKKTDRKPFTTRTWGIITCLFIVGILLFSALAGMVHTGFGAVKIWDISYITEEGGYQRALLYLPKTATADTPAPAIVACHGFNNTAEVQDINSIELARRGYVVIALDAYRHGQSGESDPNMPAPAGGGVYAALQYLGTLPYVDTDNIGMVGHSMGGGNIQSAALAAFQKQQEDPSIVVPKAVAPTAASFALDADTGNWALDPYPVNGADVLAEFEEFAGAGNKGADSNLRLEGAFGFVPQYEQLYTYGDQTPLDRQQAVAAAKNGELRVLYLIHSTHPGVHNSNKAIADITDFFDITLRDGNATIAPQSQIWRWKHIFSGIAMLGFILLAIPLGGLLLQTRFFKTLVRPEPQAYATIENGKGAAKYGLLFAVGQLPAPLLFFLCVLIGSLLTGTVLPLIGINGIALLNVVTALISLLLFFIYYKTMYKKNGASTDNMGVKLPFIQVMKCLLLAVICFGSAYLMLVAVDYFFKVDFRYWVFSFIPLSPFKWTLMLRYIPFYLIYFGVTALTLNMTTRIRGKSELLNLVLIMLASCLGLFVLWALDYGTFFATGLLMFETLMGNSTAIAGIWLWGLLFILPLAAVITRFFFKKTGTIWAGTFVNTLLVTLFAISNTVVMAGPLY